MEEPYTNERPISYIWSNGKDFVMIYRYFDFILITHDFVYIKYSSYVSKFILY